MRRPCDNAGSRLPVLRNPCSHETLRLPSAPCTRPPRHLRCSSADSRILDRKAGTLASSSDAFCGDITRRFWITDKSLKYNRLKSS